MNAEFFVLAFVAALNPKLLAIDLLLIENRRPRAMFLCVLIGGLTVGITIGLLDVLVFQLSAISSQKTASAGVDLALGLLLLAIGALVATGRLHSRRKAVVPAGGGQPTTPEKTKKDGWARLLAEPRLGLATLVGVVCGTPGAAYLSGLHILITSKSSTANQVIGVVLFVLIEFLLIIIPFTFLKLRPEATRRALNNAHDWLLGHARRLMTYTALILGAYLAISGLVRLV
ncbi:MAG TPA: GAP family protein [Streptosporangiaceae bacterium]|jgi:Sap, sulfolipid-1-addressing protein|nr:GAP family protein [Streptosporangiaceae bacterium]